MKKLVKGIIDFRENVLPEYKETFARLALGQKPDALYIGCSDSRVAVNLFASTDPGDLFVTRNVGNLIPPWEDVEKSKTGLSEGAVIEFALNTLDVSDIIVCGHSECGAMQALVEGRQKIESPHLKEWLKHAEGALELLENHGDFLKGHEKHNRVSQTNVLLQLENLKTYPIVQERIKAGKLNLHGWWFELSGAEVHAYNEAKGKFVLIDEKEAGNS